MLDSDDSPPGGSTTPTTTLPEGAPKYPGASFSGKAQGLSYKVGMARLPNGVQLSGSLCYEPASSTYTTCANGVPGLAITLQATGTFTWEDESADLSVDDGAADGLLSFDDLSGDLKLEYIVSRGAGTGTGAHPPTFRLPLALEFPVCPPPALCGGIPLYTKVELAVSIKLAAPARNTVLEGGVELQFSGSPGVDLSGTTVATTGSGLKISGKFMTNPGPSIALGASAATAAVQLKFGLGLGTRGFNVMAYVSFIGSIGQVTGSAVAEQFCTEWLTGAFITANVEAQLTLLHSLSSHLVPSISFTTPAKVLAQKTAQYTKPGCASRAI